MPPRLPIGSTGKAYSEWPTKTRRRSNLPATDSPGRRQRDQTLPNSFFRLGLALPLHPLCSALLGAHLSMCLRCRPVSLTRRLQSLPELLHVILGRLAYPCRPHGRFPSGLDAGTWGRGPRCPHTASVVQNAGKQWRTARHGKGASLDPIALWGTDRSPSGSAYWTPKRAARMKCFAP